MVDGSSLPLAEGTLLGERYRLLRLLGQGGMSRVYLAQDTRLKVQVAIKENLQMTAEAHAQFASEALILARLSHPNLPRVSDHFEEGGRQYLVMDYVEGEDLEKMVQRVGPLPEATALQWMKQILSAVEYLHAQQPPVIHRDIKPSNIKITPEGRAVLVDFGIAKVYDPRIGTLTGARAVTPGYAPPEQYGMRTTERSDIYALGATLYTLVTGQMPPEAPLRQAGEAALVPPSQVKSGLVSRRVEEALLRAMALETGRRWVNVAQLQASLDGRPVVTPTDRPTVLVSGSAAGQASSANANALFLGIGEGTAVFVIGILSLVGVGLGVILLAAGQLQPVLPSPAPARTPTLAPTTTRPPTGTPTRLPSPTALPTPVPTRPPSATPLPPPTPTSEFPPLPAGTGGLIVSHDYGDEMNYDIGGTLYKIPPGEKAYIILRPGRYTFSWNTVRERLKPDCSTADGCTVEIVAGEYQTQHWVIIR